MNAIHWLFAQLCGCTIEEARHECMAAGLTWRSLAGAGLYATYAVAALVLFVFGVFLS